MPDHEDARSQFLPRRPAALILLGVGLLALGGATGAVVTAEIRPSVSMPLATPVAIRSLAPDAIVTIRGRVADVYGNKFVIDDGTGRALVDTGPDGERHALASIGAPLMVQGRFERGVVHAAFLVGPDAKVLALGPLAGPPRRPHDGADRGPCAPPPAPAADATTAPLPLPASTAAETPAASPAQAPER